MANDGGLKSSFENYYERLWAFCGILIIFVAKTIRYLIDLLFNFEWGRLSVSKTPFIIMEYKPTFVTVADAQTGPVAAPYIRVLQIVTAILFILKLVWELYGSSILIKAGQSPEDVFSMVEAVMYVSYALWIIPFVIASNKQIRMAVLFFVFCDFIINLIPMLCDMAGCSITVGAGVTILVYSLIVSYTISILAVNAGENNPVYKWLVLWLTLSIIGYVANFFAIHFLMESGVSLVVLFRNNPVQFFNIVVTVFLIIVYWQVFRSSLFNGYKSGDSAMPLLPAVNSWVLKGFVVAVFSMVAIYIWYAIIGKSLV